MSDISSIVGPPSAVANPLGQTGPVSNAAGGAMGKDQFLKLLIAQMQNQDPLNPMDGMQFASQLAQFSSVEQLQQLNSQMQEEAASQTSMLAAVNGSVAVSTFGREVVALGNQLDVNGANEPKARFDAPIGGGIGEITIYNGAGAKVATVAAGKFGDGVQTVDLTEATRDLPRGLYTYEVEVTDSSGEVTKPVTYMEGRIDGIHYTPDGPVLTSGGMQIPFGSILKILTND